MNIEFSGDSNQEIARIQEANNRLTIAIAAIGQVAESILGENELPEHIRSSVQFYAGNGIRELVQEHINAFLVGETSIHGQGIRIGITGGFELSVDDGGLYSVPSIFDRSRDRWPSTPQDWFRCRSNIVEQITCLKYY